MKKRIMLFSVLLLTLLLAFSGYTGVAAAGKSAYRGIPITYNGKAVMGGEALLMDSTTYVPFRAVCDALGGGQVSWNDKTKTASYQDSALTITACAKESYIVANGRYFYCEYGIKNVDSRIYVPIRLMAKAFGVSVSWDPSYKVSLSGGEKLKSASEFYDDEDLYWLSRIISAESKGESLLGKIAVGNVVLNRVVHEWFPSDIRSVIFQSGQFTPVSNGMIYKEPSDDSVIAAKICLEGYTVSDDILYFCNTSLAVSTWMQKSRRYVMQIGNHSFYA